MENLVSWFLFAFILLSLWHFLFEAAIAPNWRLCQRLRLFQLRDQLRDHMIRHQTDLDEVRVAELLQTRANVSIQVLSRVNIMQLLKFERFVDSHPDLKTKIENEQQLIDSSCDELKKISRQIDATVLKAFVFNAGGWIVYIVPMIVVFAMAARLTATLSMLLRSPLDVIDKTLGPSASPRPSTA